MRKLPRIPARSRDLFLCIRGADYGPRTAFREACSFPMDKGKHPKTGACSFFGIDTFAFIIMVRNRSCFVYGGCESEVFSCS